jgi:homoserine kinase
LNEIFLRAPATIANFGPGFDIFALALDAPYDLFKIKRNDSGKVSVQISGGRDSLPTEAEKNTAGLAAIYFLEKIKAAAGADIEIIKKMPACAGLGSSAASAAAAVFGLNKIFEAGLSDSEIIEIASRGEAASGGTPHADNVAGCCLGGFVFIRNFHPLRIEKIDVPGIPIVIRVRRKSGTTSRGLIPDELPLAHVKEQMAWCAALVHAMKTGDFEKIGEAVNRDHISEPVRSRFIPDYAGLKKKVLEAGAFGCNVSGGGSSVFAICPKNKLDYVAEILKRHQDQDEGPTEVLKTKAGNRGVMEIHEL